MSNRHTDSMAITVTLIIQEGYTCVYNVQLKTFTDFAGFRILQIFGAKFTMQLLACTCVFRHVKVYVDTQAMPHFA